MRSKARQRMATLAVGLLTASLAACSSGEQTEAAAQSLVGTQAPALSGPDLIDRGTLDLTSMEGKPTVVAFWLYACPHCEEEIPDLQAAWKAGHPDANIVTVGMEYDDPNHVDTTDGFRSPEDFVTATGLTLPTLQANWSTEGARWKVEETPTVFVLDGNHVVRSVFVGPTDASTIIDAVEACFSCRAET